MYINSNKPLRTSSYFTSSNSTFSSLPSILKALGIPLSDVTRIEQRKTDPVSLAVSSVVPTISSDIEKMLQGLGISGGVFYTFSADESFNRVRSRLKQMGILLVGKYKLKKLCALLGIEEDILGIYLQEGGLFLIRNAIKEIENRD